MLVVRCQQGSPEWYGAHTGAITSSMFWVCRKTLKSGKNKGGYSVEAQKYAFTKAIERATGKLIEDGSRFETYAMRRGHELEPDARARHEQDIQELVEPTGIVLTDDRKFGASADGLIGEKGQSEYKCFIDATKVWSMAVRRDFTEIYDQVQGALWITGREWCDTGLYVPSLGDPMDWTRRRVYRDDNYIEELEQDLWRFDAYVEQCRLEYQGEVERRLATVTATKTQQPELEVQF